MRTIISKQVIALYPGGQLLQDEFFRDIREKEFNKSRYKRDEESGIQKRRKVIIDSLGLGTNDRGVNPGVGIGLGRDENESDNKGLSSGYNDGGRAQDETGPGQTEIAPDPYYVSDVFNELFLKRKLEGQDHDETIPGHTKKILRSKSVTLPHRRYNVDKLKGD